MPAALTPAFAEPATFAQPVFRAIMDAMARPASIVRLPGLTVPPAPLPSGAGAIALTLFDQDTPIWLDSDLLAAPDVTAWLRFHTGAPITTDSGRAAFAIISDPIHAPPFELFATGTAEYPDRSTTLILQVDDLASGSQLSFTGPGIKERESLRAAPLPNDFAQRFAANHALFPRGLDLLLVTDTCVAGLPRSVTVLNGA